MADLPYSGVSAIVQGIDKYVRDISRMAGANASLDRSLNNLYKIQAQTGKSAQEVIHGFEAEAAAAKRLADAQGQMAFKAQMLNQKMAEQAQAAREMGQAMTVAGAAMLAFSALLAKVGVDATRLAGRVETLGIVVNQLASITGKTPGEMRDLENALMKTGITLQAARSSISRMYQAEIDLAYATDLAREAQNAAVIANINSSEAFENLIYGIQSGNVRILRTMGLQVSFAEAYKRFGAEVGKSANALSTFEKVQARTAEVIRAGTTIVGAYEASMTTAGKKVLTLERYFEETSRTIGETFLPEYTALVDLVTASLKAWLGATTQVRAFWSAMGAGTSATLAIVGSMSILTAQLPALIRQFNALKLAIATNPWLAAAAAIGLVASAVYGLIKAEQAVNKQSRQMASDLADLDKTYADYLAEVQKVAQAEGRMLITRDRYEEVRKGATEANTMYQEMYRSVIYLTEAEWENMLAERQANAQRAILKQNMINAADGTYLLAKAQDAAAAKARGLASALFDTVKASQDMWANLTPDLSGLISGWLEAINFVQIGGAELQAALSNINLGVTTGAISPEAGKNLLEAALPAAAAAQAAAETGTTTGQAFNKAFVDAMQAGGATGVEAWSALKDVGRVGAQQVVAGVTEELTMAMAGPAWIPEGMGLNMQTQLKMAIGGMGEATDLFDYLGIPRDVDLSGVEGEFANIKGMAADIGAEMRSWDGMDTESTHTVHVEFEGGKIPEHQHGADWVVGGKGGIDSNLVMFRATRGERVTVTPASQVANTYNQQNMSRQVNIGQQTIGSRDDKVWFDRQMREWLGG